MDKKILIGAGVLGAGILAYMALKPDPVYSMPWGTGGAGEGQGASQFFGETVETNGGGAVGQAPIYNIVFESPEFPGFPQPPTAPYGTGGTTQKVVTKKRSKVADIIRKGGTPVREQLAERIEIVGGFAEKVKAYKSGATKKEITTANVIDPRTFFGPSFGGK